MQFHIGIRSEVDALIVIVNCHSQRDLSLILSHEILVHECIDLNRCRQRLRRTQIAALIVDDLVAQQFAAGLNTVAADIHAGTGDQPLGLPFPLSAETAANRLFGISSHERVSAFLRINGDPAHGPQDRRPEPLQQS